MDYVSLTFLAQVDYVSLTFLAQVIFKFKVNWNFFELVLIFYLRCFFEPDLELSSPMVLNFKFLLAEDFKACRHEQRIEILIKLIYNS